MFSRGLALGSVLVMASIAQGGVTVQLVPVAGACPNNASQFAVNSVVTVEVRLSQNAGGVDQLLRLVELDFQQTASLLLSGITFPTTHDRGTGGTGDDIHFWLFSSLTNCTNSPSFCGFNHYTDDDLPAGLVDTRPNVVSMAYYGLNADNTAQILLPGNGTPVAIGRLDVTMPALAGTHNLNVVNAADTDAVNRRARVDFGFEPHTIWRAGIAAPNDVGGGTFAFNVVNDCGSGCSLTSTIPPHTTVGQYSGFLNNSTLWRTLRHVIRVDLADPGSPGCGTLAAPTAGQIRIREMLANGAFGPDLSANFTYTIEAGNVLRIREPSTSVTVLADNKWYAISNNNWPGVGAFEVQWPVNTGDFDGNRFTTPTDVSGINGTLTGVVPDQARQDVNGDGFRTPTDVSAANAAQGPPPAKPTGH